MNDAEKAIKTIKDALNAKLGEIQTTSRQNQMELDQIAAELQQIANKKELAVSDGDEAGFITLSARENYLKQRCNWIKESQSELCATDEETRAFFNLVRSTARQFETEAAQKAKKLILELNEILEEAEAVNKTANAAKDKWSSSARAAGAQVLDGGVIHSSLVQFKFFVTRNATYKELAGLPSAYGMPVQ